MTLKERQQRLLPNGYPRWVRVYDNGGKTMDRYTVVFTGRYNNRVDRQHREYLHLGMSENPLSPQGVCLLEGTPNIIDVDEKEHRWSPGYGKSNHLGKRIHWHELPEDCKKASLHAYREVWDLYPKSTKDDQHVADRQHRSHVAG
jgi:hypothetical protein